MDNGLVVKKHSILKPMIVFGLEEKRLFAFCLQYYDSRVDANNPNFFEVSINDFKKEYPEYKNYRPRDIFRVCNAAINGIQQKPYRPTKFEAIWWFAKLKMVPEDAPETIQFSLNPEVVPFFLDIKDHFISYHMSDVKLLNKPNAWNLYEYLKEKFLNGKCSTWTVEITELRERLGVLSKYPRFADFDLYIIKRPVAEINDHSDLIVEYQKKKRGVRIHAIIFNVKTKAADPDVIDIDDLAKTFESEQRRYGISAAVAKRNTEQAEKLGKLSEAIEKIPAAHRSWKKYGKGPFSAYIASTLTKFLFQRDLFESEKQIKKNEAFEELRTYSNLNLATLAGSGNISAEKILKERANRGGDAEAIEMVLKLQEQSSTTPGL